MEFSSTSSEDPFQKSGIFVFKNSFSSFLSQGLPHGYVPVFDSQNREAATVLHNTGQVAISCGMSLKDTISIASLQETSALVSLQRNVHTLSSRLVEPFDFTVTFEEKIGVYPLLAVCTALILFDLDLSEKPYRI